MGIESFDLQAYVEPHARSNKQEYLKVSIQQGLNSELMASAWKVGFRDAFHAIREACRNGELGITIHKDGKESIYIPYPQK